MKPTLDFHGIASIELTPIVTLDRKDPWSGRFSTRTLILTDAEGNTFRVGLFAETENALRVSEPDEFLPVHLEAQKPLPACASDVSEQLRREPAENDAREARVDADRDGVPPYGRAS